MLVIGSPTSHKSSLLDAFLECYGLIFDRVDKQISSVLLVDTGLQ